MTQLPMGFSGYNDFKGTNRVYSHLEQLLFLLQTLKFLLCVFCALCQHS